MYSIAKIKSFKGKDIVFNVCDGFGDLKVCLDTNEGICNVFVSYGNTCYADEVIKVNLVDKKEADIILRKVDDSEKADFNLFLSSL